MSKPQRKRTMLTTVVVTIGALALGAGVGVYRARQASQQQTFREMELATRDATQVKKPMVAVMLTSDPSGASVRFDNIELSEKTPLVIDRDRDDKEHDVELSLEGFRGSKRRVRYDAGALTRVHERLSGEPGTLKISSKPSEQPVKVDGKLAGNTPLSMELPSGKKTVEIGDDTREVVKTTVDVVAGKVTTLSRRVPPKGALASLVIESEPPAMIVVDDEPTGRWTTDGAVELEAEVAHRVTLLYGARASKDEKKKDLVVKLKKGEKRALFVELSNPS
jgi:hypothetical protein